MANLYSYPVTGPDTLAVALCVVDMYVRTSVLTPLRIAALALTLEACGASVSTDVAKVAAAAASGAAQGALSTFDSEAGLAHLTDVEGTILDAGIAQLDRALTPALALDAGIEAVVVRTVTHVEDVTRGELKSARNDLLGPETGARLAAVVDAGLVPVDAHLDRLLGPETGVRLAQLVDAGLVPVDALLCRHEATVSDLIDRAKTVSLEVEDHTARLVLALELLTGIVVVVVVWGVWLHLKVHRLGLPGANVATPGAEKRSSSGSARIGSTIS